MTLTELKSLKVGQVVKYTNDVDKFNVEYYTVIFVTEKQIKLSPKTVLGYYAINFDDKDINHIASMLTIDQPIAYKALEPQRQLKLIEARIRDKEWALSMNYATQNAIIMSPRNIEEEIRQALSTRMKLQESELNTLRQQRNELIEKI